MIDRKTLILAAVAVTLFAASAGSVPAVSADSLRTDITYLSSRALEGRLTPSHGLDLAADYIATQFRDARLEPAAPDYFQAAKFDQATANLSGFELVLDSGARQIRIHPEDVRVQSLTALDFTNSEAVRLPANGAIPPVTGKVVIGERSRYADEALLNELEARKPALILIVGKTDHKPVSPLAPDPGKFVAEDGNSVPVLRIRDSEALDLIHQERAPRVSLHVSAPAVERATVRNVAALLPGSDPALRKQYVLVTAHYDHLGVNASGFHPGANDNASGAASVIAVARALAATGVRPRRSIVFIALFGEEEGLLGAYYYAHHPLVPLHDTVADINLEQMGRTDDAGGKRIREFGITGPSYSNVPAIVAEGARKAGINEYMRRDADDYFDRSDNFAFAQFGIVSHTIAVAFDYPDYHVPADTPDKIDYNNLAAVDRGVAEGILAVANAAAPPHWSAFPKAKVYIDAGH